MVRRIKEMRFASGLVLSDRWISLCGQEFGEITGG